MELGKSGAGEQEGRFRVFQPESKRILDSAVHSLWPLSLLIAQAHGRGTPDASAACDWSHEHPRPASAPKHAQPLPASLPPARPLAPQLGHAGTAVSCRPPSTRTPGRKACICRSRRQVSIHLHTARASPRARKSASRRWCCTMTEREPNHPQPTRAVFPSRLVGNGILAPCNSRGFTCRFVSSVRCKQQGSPHFEMPTARESSGMPVWIVSFRRNEEKGNAS
ncbi:hypothetical protein FN846DRAFT_955431 [Sphaerosporella brunnea]|uniref:Uncharacterized protein n=1 Tax=Sphaerosporella brunnea TaxID=1250544 RepID=A0A5J5ESF3_9PEZI|nr:hypothetical protein FN846DRAFT_955431 [Sphaerosporella brunnea]